MAAVIAEEFQTTLGRSVVDVVFVGDGAGQFVHADLALVVGEFGDDCGDEGPNGGFRHEHGGGKGAGIVFEAGFSHFVESVLDGQAVLNCPTVGKKWKCG